MEQRIRGISDEEATELVREIFAGTEMLMGRVANLTRVLAHSPGILKWWLPLVVAVRQPNAGAISDVRLRNLATLKTSTLNACNY